VSQKFGNKKYVCWVLQLRAHRQIKKKIEIGQTDIEKVDTETLTNITKEKRMRER